MNHFETIIQRERIKYIFIIGSAISSIILWWGFLHLQVEPIRMLGYFEVFMALTVFAHLLLMYFFRTLDKIQDSLLVVLFLLFFTLFAVGNESIFGIIGLCIFPLISFFIKGKKTGSLYVIVEFIAIICVIGFSYANLIVLTTSINQQLLTLIGVVVVFIISYAQHEISELYDQTISHVVKDIESTKDNIDEDRATDQAILSSIGEGLIGVDRLNHVFMINDRALEILGYDRKAVVGKSLENIISITDLQGNELDSLHRPAGLVYQSKRIVSGNYHYITKDQSVIPVHITAAPIYHNHKITGVISVFRDITVEQSIDKAKSEFVSLASHQLKTPLSAINWYTEMLLDNKKHINSEQVDYIEEIAHANQNMIELVNSLLNVSRIELGTFVVEPELLIIEDLLKDAVSDFKLMISEKNINVVEEYDKHILPVMLDKKLLKIVLDNLVSNAIKYTPTNGSVTIKLFYQKHHSEQKIGISIADTGCGIPTEVHSKIFTKMFRAENAQQIDANGNGLGLYIVKSILTKLGGTITFESQKDRGTTFHILLPISTERGSIK